MAADLLYSGNVYVLKKKTVLGKRRPSFCAVYQKSSSGVQRIEIFRLDAADSSRLVFDRILVLTDCISLREVPASESGDDMHVLQLFTKQSQFAPIQLGTDSTDELTKLRLAVSKAAFPHEYGPVPALSRSVSRAGSIMRLSESRSRLSTNPYDEPWDAKLVRVEVISNIYSESVGLAGHYEISAAEGCVILKADRSIAMTWPFDVIRRLGCKDAGLFLETTLNAVFEFHCLKVEKFFDQLDELVSLSCQFGPFSTDMLPVALKENYKKLYWLNHDRALTIDDRFLNALPDASSIPPPSLINRFSTPVPPRPTSPIPQRKSSERRRPTNGSDLYEKALSQLDNDSETFSVTPSERSRFGRIADLFKFRKSKTQMKSPPSEYETASVVDSTFERNQLERQSSRRQKFFSRFRKKNTEDDESLVSEPALILYTARPFDERRNESVDFDREPRRRLSSEEEFRRTQRLPSVLEEASTSKRPTVEDVVVKKYLSSLASPTRVAPGDVRLREKPERALSHASSRSSRITTFSADGDVFQRASYTQEVEYSRISQNGVGGERRRMTNGVSPTKIISSV